jgi:hypothetical protein
MLDSFGTDGVMSCVAGPVCFMLGALVVCVFWPFLVSSCGCC